MSAVGTGLEILRTMRPHQWVKNLFVLSPLIFGMQLTDLRKVALGFVAAALFSVLSGAVYLLNDIIDRDKDALHPLKRLRPIPASRLPVRTAIVALVLLVVVSLVGSFFLDERLVFVSGGYLTLNILYSFLLKHVVFVDLVCIAAGFILRILAGSVAVGVEVSVWLVLCTFLLAIFLGLGKRKHELVVWGDEAAARRRVLSRYRLPHLNMALGVTTAVTTLAYLLYTTSERTVDYFGTHNLVLTVPFIVYGLVRFMQILESHRDEDSPTDYMLRDIPLMASIALWAATVVAIIYIFPG